jgi:hypothetical protein
MLRTDERDEAALLDLGGFIRECIERAGGAVDAAAPGRLDAILPPEIADATGGRSWVSLALTTEAAGESAEMATPGSPFPSRLPAHGGYWLRVTCRQVGCSRRG